MIKGGYYLKARKIKDSAIAKAPPHVREIWDYLMREAFYRDGRELKRGQLLKSYQDIREDLAWYVGWRKCMYSKHQCEISMKWLKKATMITTRKTTRGLIITICNFDYYQTPENYESHNETYRKATRKPQTSDTIDKEGYKKEKNIKKKINKRKKSPTPCPDIFPVTAQMKQYAASKNHYPDLDDLTEAFLIHHRKKDNRFVDWYAAWQQWFRNDIKFNGRADTRPMEERFKQ